MPSPVRNKALDWVKAGKPTKKLPVVSKTWQEHKERWSDCQACGLCDTRTKIVLCKGQLPADVVFIGEAPGTSEDVLGRPFAGPAGKLLDWIVEKAMPRGLRLAYTNLVGCIPTGDQYGTTRSPHKLEILSCEPRLRDFLGIAKPKVIILTGRLSEKYASGIIDGPHYYNLLHPAAVLQADESQKGLAIQKMILIVHEAFSVAEALLKKEERNA